MQHNVECTNNKLKTISTNLSQDKSKLKNLDYAGFILRQSINNEKVRDQSLYILLNNEEVRNIENPFAYI